MNIVESMKFSENREIEKAYIITLFDNDESTQLSNRCAWSCRRNQIPYEQIQGFDGTKNNEIIIPPGLENQWFIKWLKQPNDKYSSSQIACFFSHFSLWALCATIDKPIIILEHDAICVQNIKFHKFYNCIQYLGSKEQYNGAEVCSIPPHASIYNGHWRSICRAHAYLIDSPVARNLLSYAIREGMTKTLDIFIRCDIFSIVQDGIYFYDERGTSTIEEKENYSEDA